MTDYIQVFTTVGSKEEARTVAGAIVEQRLAACVQVIGPIQSTYWWQGQMQMDEEYLCLIKTSRSVYQTLEMAIKEVHSYETPEILAMPVEEGNQDYLFWLQGELRGQ